MAGLSMRIAGVGLLCALALGVLALAGCGEPQDHVTDFDIEMALRESEKNLPAPTTPSASAFNPQPITEAEYAQLALGMSMAQVQSAVGAGCTESAPVERGVRLQFLACINETGASATLSFENGVLVDKTKTGDLDDLAPRGGQ